MSSPCSASKPLKMANWLGTGDVIKQLLVGTCGGYLGVTRSPKSRLQWNLANFIQFQGSYPPRKTKANGLFSFHLRSWIISYSPRSSQDANLQFFFHQGSKDANRNHHDMSLYSKINGRNTSQALAGTRSYIYIYTYMMVHHGTLVNKQEMLYCRQ